ncbi:MAG: helix-turn-helix domain-containing protein [Myxococcales bacterium]|nr:helix-turn-helix domain-containing protein [Myxococcales bacterium]
MTTPSVPIGDETPKRLGDVSPYLTTDEAAQYLRLSGGSSVRALVQRGLLAPSGRVGTRGAYLFLRAELDRFLRASLPGDLRSRIPTRHTSPPVGPWLSGGDNERQEDPPYRGVPHPERRLEDPGDGRVPDDRQTQGSDADTARDHPRARGSFTTESTKRVARGGRRAPFSEEELRALRRRLRDRMAGP